jgi:hypothetical protein
MDLTVEAQVVEGKAIGGKDSKNITEEEGLVTIGEAEGGFVALGFEIDDNLLGFIELVGQFQVLELDITADKLLIKLGKRSIKPFK